jgi:hypothetical protein
MLKIQRRLENIVYTICIPQTPEDDKWIAKRARSLPTINASDVFTAITLYQTYCVVESLVHESESDQLHLARRLQ